MKKIKYHQTTDVYSTEETEQQGEEEHIKLELQILFYKMQAFCSAGKKQPKGTCNHEAVFRLLRLHNASVGISIIEFKFPENLCFSHESNNNIQHFRACSKYHLLS